MSIHFGGLYLKTISEPLRHVRPGTEIKISVTNDANGNHLDYYAPIVGDPHPMEQFDSPSSIEGEKTFCYVDPSGYGGDFLAGTSPISPKDVTKKPLIIELINAMKELSPPTKQYLLQKVDQHFG